ncbi:hypothetical protein [Halomonas koreensis]|uniref:LysR substrate binding domain-containing protein n=1 Tax=Halomonas koreensis TaxID=245385 RepID=A0ABU1G2U8_9GAMM|nr:hypothetical protein [Halomonas koreensis]MDR5867266.1 hypothetical protein [Halomonas koreensis]
MSQPIPTTQHIASVPVHDLAAAWNVHAVGQGLVDPATELLAVPTLDRNNHVGWRPAFRVPSTSTLVVVHTASPHASCEEARRCLLDLLGAMAAEGSIIAPEVAA